MHIHSKTVKDMKRLFIFLSIAFLAVACSKDNGENTGKNFISFGNDKTQIAVGPCGFLSEDHQTGGPGYHFDSDFTLNGISSHIFLHISASCKGKKADLSKFVSGIAYTFDINSSYEAGYPYDIHQYCTEFSGGEIGHSPAGTWFKSGTMELKDDGKILSLDVNGTLQDGRSFMMNITTESKKFE